MSAGEGSITEWFEGLKAGNREGVAPLWNRYFQRMIRLARVTLRNGEHGLGAADEEDAALSAFQSFCLGAEQGRFAHLNGRDELWRLLTIITVRKARGQTRRQRRIKRGGGMVVRESDMKGGNGEGLDGVASPQFGPEVAVLAGEELERLLKLLADETLERVAIWRMEGLTCEEIACRLGCARRTVARQLDLIRKLWTAAFDEEVDSA